jgi:predicted AlkP superfamily phosphohydrolase/phosphomutase
LFAVYLTLVDVAEHFFWHHMEPQHYPPRVSDADFAQVIKNAYRKADSTIGTFVKELGHGYDWLVVSDHSMLPTGTVPLSGSHYRDRALSSPVGYTDQELSLDGVIIGWGPHMRRSAAVEGASIVDVTPTILYMMDVPVGRDMTGRPLLDLLAPGLTKHRQTRIVESHDHAGDPAAPPGADPGEHRLRQKLKALGYLG